MLVLKFIVFLEMCRTKKGQKESSFRNWLRNGMVSRWNYNSTLLEVTQKKKGLN